MEPIGSISMFDVILKRLFIIGIFLLIETKGCVPFDSQEMIGAWPDFEMCQVMRDVHRNQADAEYKGKDWGYFTKPTYRCVYREG